jgi:hypothetical protein
MDRFNAENEQLSSRLGAHICGPRNVSLLHAAIALEEPELVRRLISRGANPQAKSKLGSAAVYALSMTQIAKEKLQREMTKLTKNGGSLESLRPKEKQVEMMEEIVIALQKSICQQGIPGSFNSAQPSHAPTVVVRALNQELEASARRDELDTDADLPAADKYWFVLGRDFCTAAPNACQCFKSHLYSSSPGQMNDEPMTRSCPLRVEKLSWRAAWVDVKSPHALEVVWYTAAYFDVEKSIYFRSQGSNGRRNSQGICWYPSKPLAIRALELVVTAANEASK